MAFARVRIAQKSLTLPLYSFKVAQNSFFKNGKIGNLIRIYGQIILDESQKASYLYRMTPKKFGFFHESYVTAVAMTTMTFQNGGYFDFRAI